MAAKKKAASVVDAGKVIVAFALRDVFEGEGDEAVKVLAEGQRVDLPEAEFKARAEDGFVVEGKFVKMLTGVEGGRYSLKPKDNTWLSPKIFEAWKKEGYCVLSDEDPGIGDALKDREAEAREALVRCGELEGQLQETNLQLAAAHAQAVKVRELIEPDPDSGGVLDDEAQALLAEVITLIEMFPDAPEPPENGEEGSKEPELKLD